MIARVLGIVTLVLTLVASPVGAGPNTHMGQPASEHVMLEAVGGAIGGCGPALLDFIRNLPDGTTAGAFFRVPARKVLIVTDVDWQYVHPLGPAGASQNQILRLFLENLANPPATQRVFESTVVLSAAGEGGASEAMTSGIVVSSAARICPDVSPGPLGPPSGLQHLILRGYLAPDR